MTTDMLWLDSSILRMGAKELRTLIELAEERHVRVVIHAHIYLEFCRFLRKCHPEDFLQSAIDEYLAELGIVVIDFNLSKQTAENGRRYCTRDTRRKKTGKTPNLAPFAHVFPKKQK